MENDQYQQERIAILWSSNSVLAIDFLMERGQKKENLDVPIDKRNWTVIDSETKLNLTDLSVFDKIFVLAELDWAGRNIANLYGVSIIPKILLNAAKIIPIIICSFLPKNVLLSNLTYLKLNKICLNVQLPFDFISVDTLFFKVKEVTNEIILNFEDLFFVNNHEEELSFIGIIEVIIDCISHFNDKKFHFKTPAKEYWYKVFKPLEYLYLIYTESLKLKINTCIPEEEQIEFMNHFAVVNEFFQDDLSQDVSCDKITFFKNHSLLINLKKK